MGSRKIYLSLILIFMFGFGHAQSNEGAIWYFGDYAGLTWCDNYITTGEPEPLFDSQLQTNEGVATIADASCNLLFYTDGIKAWDANHTQMANTLASSPGGALQGDPSSTQSGVIVPKPLDPNSFYIFAVDANIGIYGCTYSRVDMLANGGMGDIDLAEKNVLLYTPSSEKISAVSHANGLDIWVITHEWTTNGFVVYLVTSAGVNTVTPVFSNVGQVHTGGSGNTRGYMKASPGGTMIVTAVESDAYYELFEFDNTTGVLSNPTLLTQTNYSSSYGVEFSPDEHYLYGSERWGYPLRQFDLTATNILASEVQIATLGSAYGGALQLAVDYKIYLARNGTDYLGRINDPLAAGMATNYVDQAAYLGNPTGTDVRQSNEGLPTFITSFFNQAVFEFETSCLDTVTTFTIPNPQGLDMAYWNFNYPSTDPQWLFADTITTVDFVFPSGGVYQVELITERNNDYDTLIQEVYISYIPDADLGPDITMCTNETMAYDFSFNDAFSLSGACEYYWEAVIGPNTYYDSSATYMIDKPGTYELTIYTDSICGSQTDIVEVTYNNVVADLGIDVTTGLCIGDTHVLDATYEDPTYGNTTYTWSTNQISNTINVTSSGTYTVTVDLGNCSDIDEITVSFDQPLVMPLGPDDYLCVGSNLLLDALNPGANYIWSTGGMGQEEEITQPGIYTVTVSNSCGVISDEIDLMSLDVPDADLGDDIVICQGTSEAVDASTGGPGETYQWSTNQATPQIAVFAEGLYSVTVTNQCGSSIDDIYVYSDTPLTEIFTTDTIEVCAGDILDTEVENAEYMWSTGEVTQSVVVAAEGDYGVDVINACGTYSDVVYVKLITIDDVLPQDTVMCPGETMVLDAGNTGAMFMWSTGAMTQTAQVPSAGEYTLYITNVCETVYDTINITEFDPTLELGADTTICQGDFLELDATHEGASYVWSNGQTTPILQVLETGLYAVTVSHHCAVLNDEMDVTVLESPTVNFGSDSIISQSDTVLLAPVTANATTFRWSTSETSETITVTQPGWYSVIVTGPNGCETEEEVFVDFYWGIDEVHPEAANVILYPNPAKDQINVGLNGIAVKSIEVYSSIGQIVSTINQISEITNIDTHTLSDGLYFVKLHTESGGVIIKPFNIVK